MDPEAYDRLYAFNGVVGDYLENDAPWQEIRIRPGLAEDAVYRLLPCAGDFEYGGYLTKTRIRFIKCDPSSARMPQSKASTFHSHPTGSATADLPSAGDVFQFLNFRYLRAITVGSTRLWVWDKTKATLPIVRKFGAWNDAIMLKEVHRLEKTFPHNWHEPLAKLALSNLGLDWPKKLKDWQENWPAMLRQVLKIKVRVISRNPGVDRP